MLLHPKTTKWVLKANQFPKTRIKPKLIKRNKRQRTRKTVKFLHCKHKTRQRKRKDAKRKILAALKLKPCCRGITT